MRKAAGRLLTALAVIHWEKCEMTHTTLALSALAFLSMAPTLAMAQDAPPTYKADPSVYKIIFEDQNYRVIAALRKKGAHDKPHSHPVPSVVYFLTDCNDKLTGAD